MTRVTAKWRHQQKISVSVSITRVAINQKAKNNGNVLAHGKSNLNNHGAWHQRLSSEIAAHQIVTANIANQASVSCIESIGGGGGEEKASSGMAALPQQHRAYQRGIDGRQRMACGGIKKKKAFMASTRKRARMFAYARAKLGGAEQRRQQWLTT